MKLGLYEQARDDFDKAAKAYSEKGESASQTGLYKVKYNQGINYRNLGQLDKSIDEFKVAIDLNENKPCAYNNRGMSLFEAK